MIRPKHSGLFSLFMLLAPLLNAPLCADDNAPEDMGKCYFDGVQLYNQGRLGEAFDNFECAKRKRQNSKQAESYLMSIREDIKKDLKQRESEKALSFQGNSPESAFTVSRVTKGHIKITLQTRYLFDENSASFRSDSMDVLNRISDLLQKSQADQVELTLIDELDDTPQAKDVDADRALAIFALLNFKKSA